MFNIPVKTLKPQQSTSTVQAEENRGTLSIKQELYPTLIDCMHCRANIFFYIILKYEPIENSSDLEMYNQENQERVRYTLYMCHNHSFY